MLRFLLAITLAACSSLLLGRSKGQQPFIAITDITVLPSTGAPPAVRTVVIAGERISGVYDGVHALPKGTKVINGKGKFLIPGLWDSHVHLAKAGRQTLPLYIANGVTSVRDMGGDYEQVLAWKREIATGVLTGPRIRSAGRILESRSNVERMFREGGVEPYERTRIGVGSAAEADEAVDLLARMGVDFLKIRTVQSRETYLAIAAAARRYGLPLAGHPPATADDVIRAGQVSVDHGFYPPLDDRTEHQRRALFRRMADDEIYLGTTLVNFEGSLLIPKEKAAAMVDDFRGTLDYRRRLVSGYLLDDWKEQIAERTPEYEDLIQKALPGMVRDFKEMHQAGVRMLPGTDVGVALIYPGFSLHDELASLVKQVGLTPAEALIAATKNAASWFGMEKRVGTIQRGMTADLVVLDADPLTDIQNTKKIRAVIQAGRLYERDDLDKLLKQAESAAKAETTSRLKRLEGQPQMNADKRR